MRRWAVLVCLAATSLGAQEPAPPPAESASQQSTPLPATPEQERFLQALRTATRGIAQLKDGLSRVTRTQASRDTSSQRRAGRLLGGLCGSARAFMARGRARMNPTVYADSTRIMARRLATQIDSLIAYMPTCEQGAAKTPGPVATDLGKKMKSYETALQDFRAAIGFPVKPESSKTPGQQ